MLSFDANILIYATDMDDEPRQRRALDLLASAAKVGAGLTEQTLIEFVNVSMKKTESPLDKTRHVVSRWLETFRLLTPGPSIVVDVLELLAKHRLSAWDARLLAVCAKSGCAVLISEDLQDGAEYAGVRVLNPFNAANADNIAELLE